MRLLVSIAILTGAMLATSKASADTYYFNMDFRDGSGKSADFYNTGFPSAQMVYNMGGDLFPYVPLIPAGGDANCFYLGPVYSLFFYNQAAGMAADETVGEGFGTTSGILFEFQHDNGSWNSGQENLDDGDPDHGSSKLSLPTATRDGHLTPMGDPHPSTVPQIAARSDRSSVFLISVDASSSDFLQLYPVTTDFGQSNFCPATCGLESPLQNIDCGGKKNKLSIVPLQGVPLRPNTLYAAVITNGVTHDNGTPIDTAPGLTSLLTCMSTPACDASHGLQATGQASGISANAYDEYAQAIRVLQTATSSTYESATVFNNIRALTVFQTGDPTLGFQHLVSDATTNPKVDGTVQGSFAPAASRFPMSSTTDFGQTEGQPGTALTADGLFDAFCVYQANVSMPTYQKQQPVNAFDDTVGEIEFDDSGVPILQGSGNDARGRIFITIPRTPMPANGYPVVVMERAGGGGDVPLVARGPQNDHFPVYGWSGLPLHTNVDPSCKFGTDDLCETQPGAGPAKWFAMAGYAAVQIDDPLGGARRPADKTIGDEDGLIFDVSNPIGIRDNIRQAALELVVLAAKTLPSLTIPANVLQQNSCTVSACTFSTDYTQRTCTPSAAGLLDASGLGAVKLDLSSLTLMGHSVGATVAPLALSATNPLTGLPFYKKGILSGAGGSMLNNVLYKEEPATPLPLVTYSRNGLREVAESWALLNRQIYSEGDPALAVVQWALEPWDAQVYNAASVNRLTHSDLQYVLQFQGLLDHYIESPIADSAALSAGYGVGITSTMKNDPRWTQSYDTDSGFYNHAGTTWEWEDSPDYHLSGVASGYDGVEFPSLTHDWRAFEPLSSVVDLGGLYQSGSWGVLQLPQTGASLVVQINNYGYPAGGTSQWASYIGANNYQDGHEVMFQHLNPKLQYECFLQSALLGKPIIPDEVDEGNGHFASCCPHLTREVGLGGMPSNCSPCVNAVCQQQPQCCDPAAQWVQVCSDEAKRQPVCGPTD